MADKKNIEYPIWADRLPTSLILHDPAPARPIAEQTTQVIRSRASGEIRVRTTDRSFLTVLKGWCEAEGAEWRLTGIEGAEGVQTAWIFSAPKGAMTLRERGIRRPRAAANLTRAKAAPPPAPPVAAKPVAQAGPADPIAAIGKPKYEEFRGDPEPPAYADEDF